MSISMASYAQWNYLEPVFRFVSFPMMILTCLFDQAIGAGKIFSRLESSRANSVIYSFSCLAPFRMKQFMLFVFYPYLLWVISKPFFSLRQFFISMRSIPIFCKYTDLLRMFLSPFFFLSTYLLEIVLKIFLLFQTATHFTCGRLVVKTTFLFMKIFNIFEFSTNSTLFFHDVLQKKMPIASRSSLKQQAKWIISQYVLTRLNTYYFNNYSIEREVL